MTGRRGKDGIKQDGKGRQWIRESSAHKGRLIFPINDKSDIRKDISASSGFEKVRYEGQNYHHNSE